MQCFEIYESSMRPRDYSLLSIIHKYLQATMQLLCLVILPQEMQAMQENSLLAFGLHLCGVLYNTWIFTESALAERDGKRCNCLAVLTCAMDTTTFQSELIELPLSSK